MNKEELIHFAESMGEKSFRGVQLFEWIYKRSVNCFDEMTNLSQAFRKRLNEAALLKHLEIIERQKSKQENAEKFLFKLHDGYQIESVLMQQGDRQTLCISSQVGCPIDCKFCATGKMGLIRNLNPGEMVEQLLTIQKCTESEVSNVVLMGMGEPMNNYDAVLKACYLMTHEEGPNLAQRHIVISTSGLIPQIRQFTKDGHKIPSGDFRSIAVTDDVRTKTDAVKSQIPYSRSTTGCP